jgi:hypothetical protein
MKFKKNLMKYLKTILFLMLLFYSPLNWTQEVMMPEDYSIIEKEKNKVCTNCKTLIFKNNNPVLLFVNIDKNYNESEKKFNAQSNIRYWQINTEREFEELKSHWDYTIPIFNNTKIVIENSQNQVFDFLDQTLAFNGIIYWSGKKEESAFYIKEKILLTEKIAEITKQKMKSNYLKDFIKDSIFIDNAKRQFTPSKNMKENILPFVLNDLSDVDFFHLMNIDFDKVKKINVNFNIDNEIRAFNYDFDKLKSKIIYSYFENNKMKKNSTIFLKNSVPIFKLDEDVKTEYNYSSDTLFISSKYYLESYALKEKTFLPTNSYTLKDDISGIYGYKEKMLKDVDYVFYSHNGMTCIKTVRRYISKQESIMETCYDKFNLSFPFKKTFKDAYFEGYKNVSLINGDIVIEDKRLTKKLIFQNSKINKIIFFDKKNEIEVELKVKIE